MAARSVRSTRPGTRTAAPAEERRWGNAVFDGNRNIRSEETSQIPNPFVHIHHLSHLLELERAAEVEKFNHLRESPLEVREALGVTVSGLNLQGIRLALGGNPILYFTQAHKKNPRPFHGMEAGDLVLLTALDGTQLEGTVSAVHKNQLGVAVSSGKRFPDTEWRVDMRESDVTYRRMKGALDVLESASNRRTLGLRNVLLGLQRPAFDPLPEIKFRNSTLNSYQKQAIQKALAAKDVAVIHGPPGTGKTTVLAELIYQSARRGQKVLATAPSNVAVDNLLEKLLPYGLKVVRLGHPARIPEPFHAWTLEALLKTDRGAKRIHRLESQLQKFPLELQSSRARHHGRNKTGRRYDAKKGELRGLEQRMKQQILNEADVILTTHGGISGPLRSGVFDLAVMDEASQAPEPLSWIPLLQAKKAVFAGDPMQLPPTLHSQEAVKEGLGRTLMERLMAWLPPALQFLLRVQYRMHRNIMDFSSQNFYENSLVPDPSVEMHTAKDLAGVSENDLTRFPVQFWDTAGAGFKESWDDLTQSRENEGEAKFTLSLIQQLLKSGIKPAQIGVITPYAAQVRRLKELMGENGPEVRTVDGFQGREKEVIVISLVRSNLEKEIGFLNDFRRLNVALTRARRSLILIGDSATLGSHPLYARLMEYIQERGVRRSFLVNSTQTH
ncbi:MAG: AAA family ATPase [Elusimicrobia bacterium]|nr:AAA family ATPase [Elusimicrobiota bacterium]